MSCKISSIALGFFICFNLHASILLPLPELGAKSTETAVNATKLHEFSLRHRMMSYDPSYLFAQGKAAEKQIKAVTQRNIKLDLFDDRVIQAKVNRTYTRPDGKTVWVGQVEGDANSSVNLIADNNQLTANIRSKGQVFQIRTQTDGSLLVNEFVAPKNYQLMTFFLRQLIKNLVQNRLTACQLMRV
jgi:hypothetical protein